MTLGLTYNSDLSRVQIAVTGPPSGTVHIERSLNGLYWETVRGGAAVPVVGGVAQLDDYEFGADRENMYRYSGEAPSIVAAAASDPAASDPAVAPSVDAPTAGLLVSAWTSYEHNTAPYTIPGGMTEVVQQTGVNWSIAAVATEAVAAGATGTRSASIGAADAWSAASVVIPGDITVEDAQWSYFNYNDWAEDGDGPSVTTAAAEPGWWAVAIASCDLDNGDHFGAAPAGWTLIAVSPTGQSARTAVWAREVTEDGPVSVSYETVGSDNFLTVLLVSGLADGTETASITPDLDGRVWLKSIRYPFLNRWIEVLDWSDISRAARGGVHEIVSRSVPVAVTDVRASQAFTLEIATRDFRYPAQFDPLTEARDLDLTLASGAVMFIQTPAASPVPGGYVRIDTTSQGPIGSRRVGIDTETFALPCRIVAPPGPGVVGGTMTYRALMNLYGSYNAVLAANPTYASLLDLMASPDDLVVL